MTDKPRSGYGKLAPGLWRWLLRNPVVAVTSHWMFQSLLYMDATERWFKIGLDVALTIVIGTLLSFRLSWPMAGLVALLLAHTLNFLFNGHLWGAVKHHGFVRRTREDFGRDVHALLRRAHREPAIQHILIGGGVLRDQWSPASDVDVRFIRRPGWWNGLRACWFVLSERTRAFFSGLALDAYVLDSDAAIAGEGFEDAHRFFSD